MEYFFRNDLTEAKSFTVKQFENHVTKVNLSYTNTTDGVDITDLVPMLIVSTGDVVPVGEELSYSAGEEGYMTAVWSIDERYTQRAGSYFIQLAFSDSDNQIKLYSEKLMMIVEPSVDYQRDFLEYNPLFMESFRQGILEEIRSEIPTKTSDLENDSGFFSRERELSEYATSEYVDNRIDELENKEKWRQIIRFTTPVNATQSVSNVNVAFDSTGKYIENILISKDSDGNNISLRKAAIYIKRTVVMGAAVGVSLYGNATDVSSGGTLLIDGDTFIEKGKAVLATMATERVHNRWKSSAEKQNTDNGERQTDYIDVYTEKLTAEALNNLRLTFVPATTPLVNILSMTTIEVWGVDA